MPDALPAPSLDALLARAEDLALFSMRARGKVLPTLLAVGAGGPICFITAYRKSLVHACVTGQWRAGD
jgi:hypothetical protein